MKIAVLSDTHSRYETVAKALKMLEGRGAAYLLHCGDIQDAETVSMFPANTHFVFGNCDYERDEIRAAVGEAGSTMHEPFGQLELPGAKIAFTHGDDQKLLLSLLHSREYDYLFHGHTHIAADARVGRTRVINPGALHRAVPHSFIVLDLATGEVESLVVE